MFPSSKSFTPVKRIIESIGYSHGRPDAQLLKIREQTVNMINDGRQFKPSGRATREDSYIDEAAQCITNYCHSDESSRTDTNSYRVYEIRNPADRKDNIRKCEQRVWNEVTWKNRFEAFLKSLAYAKFLREKRKGFVTQPSEAKFVFVSNRHVLPLASTYTCQVWGTT